MRVFVLVTVLSLALMATPLRAQTPAPAPTAPVQPAPALPAPFPEGAKVAWIDLQRVANESSDGKVSTAKVQALNTKKVNELNEKNKSLQAAQQKLQTGGTVLSDEARSQLEKDINKLQREIQNFTQEAQEEVQELQQQLQGEFTRRLLPVVNQVATEKGLHIVLSRADAGIVWGHPGLDITSDVIKRFDAASGPAAAPSKPAPSGSPAKPPRE